MGPPQAGPGVAGPRGIASRLPGLSRRSAEAGSCKSTNGAPMRRVLLRSSWRSPTAASASARAAQPFGGAGAGVQVANAGHEEATMKEPQLQELLYQALETEQGG